MKCSSLNIQAEYIMENSNRIVPPHLNAEVYRTDTTGTNTLQYLDYIRIHQDNSVLIGCSELTGRYWNGAASIYKSSSESQNLHKTGKKNISLYSGTADGCFLETSEKVLLCEDSGAVSVWSSCENEWKEWNQEVSVAEHDDAVLAVDCLDPGKEYVTVGADGKAKVWDINELLCVRNYDAAHTAAIYGVAVRPKSDTNFVTGSLDQYITLWDDNVSKPVLDLTKNDCGIRCLRWLDENQLIFGDEAGVLSLVDVRNNDTVTRLAEFPAALHGIAINSTSDKIGVCCDNKIVSVYKVTDDRKAKLMYINRKMHSNFVRGLAWDPCDKHLLHTLGWDGEIKTHSLKIHDYQ